MLKYDYIKFRSRRERREELRNLKATKKNYKLIRKGSFKYKKGNQFPYFADVKYEEDDIL